MDRRIFLSFTVWMFVDVCLCSSSGRFHGVHSIPDPCCSSATCAGQDGALAHSLVPAALGSAKLGLCMILINTKYVAAAQKGFVVQAQPFAHSWGLPGSGFAWCFAFSDWWIQMLHFACSGCCMQRQFCALWSWMWTFLSLCSRSKHSERSSLLGPVSCDCTSVLLFISIHAEM